jgi:hypothetical protein
MNENFFNDEYVAWRGRRLEASLRSVYRLYGKDAARQIMAMSDFITQQCAPVEPASASATSLSTSAAG